MTTVVRQALGTKIQVDAHTDPSSLKEELAYKMLQELDPYKLMGPESIHTRVLGELAHVIARLLSIIFEKWCRSGDISADRKKTTKLSSTSKWMKRRLSGVVSMDSPRGNYAGPI